MRLSSILSGSQHHDQLRVSSRGERDFSIICEDPALEASVIAQGKQMGFRVARRKSGVVDLDFMEEPAKGQDISSEHQGHKLSLEAVRNKIRGWRKKFVESGHLAGFRKASKFPRDIHPTVAANKIAEFTYKLGSKLKSRKLLRMARALKKVANDPIKATAMMERLAANKSTSSNTVTLSRPTRPMAASDKRDLGLYQDAVDFAETYMNRNSLRKGDKELTGQLDSIGTAWEKSLSLKGIDASPADKRVAWAKVVDTLRTAMRAERRFNRLGGEEGTIDATVGWRESGDQTESFYQQVVGSNVYAFDNALTEKADKKQTLLMVGKLIEYYAPIQHPKRITEGDIKKFLVENYPAFATKDGLEKVQAKLKELVDIPERHKEKEDPAETKAAAKKRSAAVIMAELRDNLLRAEAIGPESGYRDVGDRLAAYSRRLRLSVDMTNIFQQFVQGPNDPLYSLLSRRGGSPGDSSVTASEEEVDRLTAVAKQLMATTKNSEALVAASQVLRQLRDPQRPVAPSQPSFRPASRVASVSDVQRKRVTAVRLLLHYADRLRGCRVAGGARGIMRIACGMSHELSTMAHEEPKNRAVLLREHLNKTESGVLLQILLSFPFEVLPKLKEILEQHEWTRADDIIIKALPEVKKEAVEVLGKIAGKEKKERILIEDEKFKKPTIGGLTDETSLSSPGEKETFNRT